MPRSQRRDFGMTMGVESYEPIVEFAIQAMAIFTAPELEERVRQHGLPAR